MTKTGYFYAYSNNQFPTMKNVDEQLKAIRTAEGKTLFEIQQKRARATALVLAGTTVVSLIFMVFSFVQKSAADEAILKLHAVKQQLELCQSGK
jgi:hypothetical protein